MLSSLRNGSRRHAPFIPDIAALHCSIELNLQFLVKELSSSLQYSPARTEAVVNGPLNAIVATNAEIVIALNRLVVICIAFRLACVSYYLIHVRSERELSAANRAKLLLR